MLNEIRAHSQAVAQDENAVLDKLKQQILSESAAKQEDSKLEISRLRRRIGELEHMTAKLYEDKVSGAINGDTFAVLIKKASRNASKRQTAWTHFFQRNGKPGRKLKISGSGQASSAAIWMCRSLTGKSLRN